MAINTQKNKILNSAWYSNLSEAQITVPNGGTAIFAQSDPVIDIYGNLIEDEGIEVNETLAPSIPRDESGIPEGQPIYKLSTAVSRERQYPLISTDGNMQASKLTKRILGIEPPYYTDIEQAWFRSRFYVTRISALMIADHARTQEKWSWDAIQSGEFVTQNGTVNLNRKGGLKGKTASTIWGEANANPLNDMGSALSRIRKIGKSSKGLNVAILGETAWLHLSNYLKAQPDLKNISVNHINAGVGIIVPSNLSWMLDKGYEYHGWVVTPFSASGPIHLFTYPEYYAISPQEEISDVPYVAQDNCIIMKYNPVHFKNFFGGVEILPTDSTYYENNYGMVFDDAMSQIDFIGGTSIPTEAMVVHMEGGKLGSGIDLRIQTAPLPNIRHTGTVCNIDTSSNADPVTYTL